MPGLRGKKTAFGTRFGVTYCPVGRNVPGGVALAAMGAIIGSDESEIAPIRAARGSPSLSLIIAAIMVYD
jgi:hypothetical protein